MKQHRSITTARLIRAVTDQMVNLENPGICIACGEDADGCEPDAERCPCAYCGLRCVYGAELLLIGI